MQKPVVPVPEALQHYLRGWLNCGFPQDDPRDGLLCTDTLLRIHHVNPQGAMLTGFAPEHLCGLVFSDVFQWVDEHTGEALGDPLAACLDSGRVEHTGNHHVLMAVSGLRLPVAGSATPLRDADGGCVGVLLVFRDVTSTRLMLRHVCRTGLAPNGSGATGPAQDFRRPSSLR